MVPISVQIPHGTAPGQTLQVATPDGHLVQVQIPPGAFPGSIIQVGVPSGPYVVTAQPGSDPAEVQARVHSTLRDGKWGVVTASDALAYSRTLTVAQASAQNPSLQGCHRCRPVSCCGFAGCVRTVNCACGPDCLWFPCCFLGCCCPIWSLICCVCEREKDGSNAWITRDKHGNKTGAVIVVDHERGTLAHYGVKGCCNPELDPTPQCYCEGFYRTNAVVPV